MPRQRPWSIQLGIAAALLAVAMAFGGGGFPAPVPGLVVELAALAAWAAALLVRPAAPPPPADRTLWICVAVFAAIPLVQLVPLPPAIWHALPGRDVERASLALVGLEDSWRPIAVDPYRTLAAALSLIPPVVMIFLISRLSLSERGKLLATVAAMGGAAALVGLVQRASGHGNLLRFYDVTNYGFATGFQANRNADADVLLIALLALAAVVKLRREMLGSLVGRALAAAGALFLGLSIVLTGSRMGTALIAAALVGCLFIANPRLRLTRNAMIAGVAGVVVLAAAIPILASNPALEKTWSRYSDHLDPRAQLWDDTLFVARRQLATGVGVGNFVPVFEAQEPLESVDSSAPNRAHNDYLEWTLETGLPGLAVAVVLAVLGGLRAVRIIRRTPSDRYRTQAAFAVGALGILGLHSLVDYPMRSMSLATLCAVAIGMLSSAAFGRRDRAGAAGNNETAVDGGARSRGIE